MSEPSPTGIPASDAAMRHAGQLLRDAREAQGLSLEALSFTLKVTPAKLEALEQGRFDSLPDANFARALAMTVCRYLKLDPADVVAGLPAARAIPLTSDKPPLNQPFKDFRTTGPLFDRSNGLAWAALLKPQWLAPLALLLAALVIYALPEQMSLSAWMASRSAAPASAASVAEVPQPAGSAAEAVPLGAPMQVSEQPSGPVAVANAASDAAVVMAPAASAALPASVVSPSASPVEAGFTAAQPVPAEQGAPVQLRAEQASWIEVRDGKGEKIFSRQLGAGETASVDGVPPLKLRIGNATHVQLSFRGQAVDLVPYTRSHVARLELK
jgi:cytoskeleton protein RodZ